MTFSDIQIEYLTNRKKKF